MNMKLVYYLKDESQKTKLSEYNPDGITHTVFSLDGEIGTYVSFIISGENRRSAKRLSEIDKYVTSTFDVITIENGCAAYCNKSLYPLISDFERNLRRFLYSFSSIHPDDKASKNIKGLEAMDFGSLFTMLFIDSAFMEQVKGEIKNRNKDCFSKNEVLSYLKSIDENTMWDTYIGKEIAPTLRNNFLIVKEYRNDVMHSHNFGWDRYLAIHDMFTKINKELTEAYESIRTNKTDQARTEAFNQSLSANIKAQEIMVDFHELGDRLGDWFSYGNKLSQMIETAHLSSRMREIKENLEMMQTIYPENVIQDMMKAVASSPEYLTFKEMANIFKKQTDALIDQAPKLDDDLVKAAIERREILSHEELKDMEIHSNIQMPQNLASINIDSANVIEEA